MFPRAFLLATGTRGDKSCRRCVLKAQEHAGQTDASTIRRSPPLFNREIAQQLISLLTEPAGTVQTSHDLNPQWSVASNRRCPSLQALLTTGH